MLKNKKMLLALLLVAAMLVTMMTGCAGKEEETVQPEEEPQAEVSAEAEAEAEAPQEDIFEDVEDISFSELEEAEDLSEFQWGSVELPLTEEPVTFTYWMSSQPFMMSYGGTVEYEELPFFTKMEERTGVHLDMTVASMAVSSEQFNLMIASGDYSDMFEGEYTGGAQQGIEDEVILPLNDLLESDMPNYLSWLEYSPAVRKIVTTDAGNVYRAAYITYNDQGQQQGPMLRADWLEETGLDLPKTYDDLHEVLTAFKENGHEGAFWMTSALQAVFYAWSAGYDCNNEFLVKDGVIEYSPITDNYRDYVDMMRQWYNEGLVYSDFINIDASADSIDTGLVLGGTVGVWAGDTSTAEVLEERGGFPISAFTYPTIVEGDTVHLSQNEEFVSGGTIISTACEEKEIAARWLDYMYTYDGYILGNYGTEGETFDFNDEGQAILYDEVVKNEKFITPVGFVLYTRFGGAGICDNFRNTTGYSERNWADVRLWESNIDNDHLMPKDSILNSEESLELSNIMTDIETYIEEVILKFVIGDMDMSQWDEYVANVESMGIQAVIDLNQTAYDRYMSK